MEAVANLGRVFYKPTRVFEWVAEKPNWWLPAIALMLAAGLFTGLSATIGLEAAIKEMKNQAAQVPPEVLDQMRSSAKSPLTSVFAATSGAVGAIISLLVSAGIIHLIAKAFGGSGKYSFGLAMVAFSRIPSALQGVLQSAYVASTGKLVSPGLVSLLPKSAAASPLGAVLSSIDIFSIWGIVLLAIGLRVVYKLSKKRAVFISVGLWAVVVGFAALAALLTRSISF